MPTRRMSLASGGSPTLGDCAAAGTASAMASADVRHAKRASNFFTAILHSIVLGHAEPHVLLEAGLVGNDNPGVSCRKGLSGANRRDHLCVSNHDPYKVIGMTNPEDRPPPAVGA